jgi:single-stranded DNA-binding protein
MQVYGNIAGAVEKKTSKNGRMYFRFRIAENQGKDENKSTQWYDVNAFIDELDGDLLNKGLFVKVTGRLECEAYMKKDNTPGASLLIMANSVVPVEKKSRPAGEE